jgi:hypothetical protein
MMGRICSMHESDQKYTYDFGLTQTKKTDHQEDVKVDVRLMLKWV